MSTLYENIRKRREELGMTQGELAKKLNYKSKSTVNKIEAGINDITQSKIKAFADALDTTPSYLMGWTDKLEITTSDRSAKLALKIRSDIDAIELLETYYSLSDDKKAIASKLIKSLTD